MAIWSVVEVIVGIHRDTAKTSCVSPTPQMPGTAKAKAMA